MSRTLRIAVVGGGCSGFSYSMSFDNNPGMLDKTYNSDGFKVFVDQASLLYLDGVEVDFVADNPGDTLLHCHMQLHMDFGFMQLIKYAT